MHAFLARGLRAVAALLALALFAAPAAAQSAKGAREEVIRLWSGQAPGTESWTGDEIAKSFPDPGGPLPIVTNITVPSMTVVRPAPGKANGTAMVVLPGGGFQILAWQHEGMDVAHWLADRGITAFVLKYRVREAKPEPGITVPTDMPSIVRLMQPLRKIAVADAAQAMRILRRDAARYGILPDRIGMIGFSAGAITTMGLILEGEPAVRPNFAAPIYGLTMIDSPKVPADAPPLFIAATQDDFLSTGSIEIYNLWSSAKRPAELHIYDKGGHGFGMRKKNLPVDNWITALGAWLGSRGYLTTPTAPIH